MVATPRTPHWLFSLSPPRHRVALVFLTAFALQLLAYWGTIAIRPSADDFILPVQIRRGESDGPLAFFKSSPLNDYRPLQSLVYWAVGQWAVENPFPLIHVLNFVSFAFYAAVVAGWVIQLRMSLWGALCTALLPSLHPVLAGPLADLDGFTRFVVSGWVWLGTLLTVRFAHDLRLAVPLAGACLLIGLGFMEYAVGLIPLSVLGLWWARDRRRFSGVVVLGFALLLVFAVYFLLRTSVVESGAGKLTRSPSEWIRNLVMLMIGVSFMGNTVWVYFHQGVAAYALVGASGMLLALAILAGLASWYRTVEDADPSLLTFKTGSREIGFLVTAFFASFTPMVFMAHISEIYASAIVVPLSLAVGRAADGWVRLSRPAFTGLGVALAVLLVWASVSVRSKVESIRQTGARASVQLARLLEWIPAGTSQQKVALVFLKRDLPPLRTYSVFLAGDDHLLQPGAGVSAAMEWHRPGARHRVKHLVVADRSEIQEVDFDLVLRWDPVSRTFERWK